MHPLNQNKYFKVSITNQITKKPVKYAKIKIKICNAGILKIFKVKTNNKGIVLINTNFLDVGKYYVFISTANNYYFIYLKSKIFII